MTPAQFTEWGGLHKESFLARARQLTHNEEDAEDLMQDAALVAFRHRDKFQDGTNFLAWGLTIIHNTFITDYRKRQRRRRLLHERPPVQAWAASVTAHNLAESSMTVEEIMCRVGELDTLYRLPFELFLRGHKYQEISLRLNIPVGTAKSRVFTARSLLRPRLAALRPLK